MDALTNNSFFGIVLSLVAFEFGLLISKKTKIPIFNPLLIAIIFIIGILVAFNINIEDYNIGGDFINMFLGPCTVVLAVPLYKQIELLKEHSASIIAGVLIGSMVGMFSIISLSHFLGLNSSIIKSLLPKSVTTPIGIEVSNSLGGLVPITILAIIITGICGAIIGPTICRLFRINNKVAVGISIGTASHAVGTSKALELGEIEGAMSGLSIGIAGLFTVVLAPLTYNLAYYIYTLIKF